MTPNIVAKKYIYVLPLYVNFESEITICENDVFITLEKKKINNITFGKIPIIVNSKYCVLNHKGLMKNVNMILVVILLLMVMKK